MKYLKHRLLLILLWLPAIAVFGQFDIPPKPELQTSVYDYVELLSETQRKTLEQKLIRYADSTSTQIVCIVISSTQGENIQYLGAQWGHAWEIGQEKEDNGILILLAKDDRRIAINTGYGVEEFLTDALSKRIIDRVIIPEFKAGDYYSGLDKGADAIFDALNGEFSESRNFDNSRPFPFEMLFPFLIFIVLIIIFASRNKGRGGRGNRGGRNSGLDLWDIIILSNMGRSGSSGGGFGGGGFGGGGGFSGGFGGGGFGGGGASGGW